MKFIFLDLEFNQKPGWIFDITRGQDIIQLAYTVRDDNFKDLSSKNSYIKYNYMEISQKVKLLTGITFENIKRGRHFDKVALEFLGEINYKDIEDTYIMTWGDTDLRVLKRNFYKYNIKSKLLDKLKVVDVQKIYMKRYELKDHPSLIKAFEEHCYEAFINSKNKHHNAFYDAIALAEIAKSLGRDYILENINEGLLLNIPLKEFMLDRSVRIKLSNDKFKKFYTNRHNCKCCGKFTKLIFNDYICLDILNEHRYHSQIRYCKNCDKVFIKRENVTSKHKIISSRVINMDMTDKNYRVLKRNIFNHKTGEIKLMDFLDTV